MHTDNEGQTRNTPLTSMNSADCFSNSENGRHERNDVDCVILLKKSKHPCVEKLFESVWSNGWGNGVGRTGGVDGIVGVAWVPDELVGVAEVSAEDALEDVGVANDIVSDAPSSGLACRLCGRHSASVAAKSAGGRSPTNMSRRAGCEMYRVDAVIRTSTSGTRRIDHRVRRAVRRLAANEDACCSIGVSFVARGSDGGSDEHRRGSVRGTSRNCELSSSDSLGVGDGSRAASSIRDGAGDAGGVNILRAGTSMLACTQLRC